MPCVPIDIEIEIITPDQLRKITFGLVKSCLNDGTESWKINFELDEKKAATDANFKEVAKVSVAIGKQDHPAAQAIADNKSLSDAQTAQALAAADTVKQSPNPVTDPNVHDDVTQILHADDDLDV
jgi:hypothetical protein